MLLSPNTLEWPFKTGHKMPLMIIILNTLVVLFFIAFWFLVSAPLEYKIMVALVVISWWLWIYNYYIDMVFDADDDNNPNGEPTDEVYHKPASQKEAPWKPMTNDEMSAASAKRKFDETNTGELLDTQVSRPEKEPRVGATKKPVLKSKQSLSEPLNDLPTTGVAGSKSSQAMLGASTIEKAGDAKTDGGKANAQMMATPTVASHSRDACPVTLLPNCVATTDSSTVKELMAPKKKKPVISKPHRETPASLQQPTGLRLENPGKGGMRDTLGVYASNPSTVPRELRLYNTDDFVVIKDLYPKSTVHLLLLFTSPRNSMHPFHFFEDPEILAKTREEVNKLRHTVAKELAKKFGKFSAQDKERQQLLSGEITIPDGAALPKGRDWESEVMVGIHARPSMNHVHVHILSRDRFSSYMTKRNHYQSFNTPFFVDLDNFPLAEDDPRWDSNQTNSYLRADFICWRCGKTNFKNFPALKEHLAEEFRQWRAE